MLVLLSNLKAVRAGGQNIFAASGGTGPYIYSLRPEQGGGTINASNGLYTGPYSISLDPRETIDTIIVTDSLGDTAELDINLLTIEEMIADIIMREMSLSADQVFLYNQKINIPNDSRLYISVIVNDGKYFGNNIKYDSSGSGVEEVQSVSIKEMITVDIRSRNRQALRDKELVLMSLASTYSTQQQEINSFGISKLPITMNNISDLEGSAIPYRFNFLFAIQYSKTKVKSVDYYDTFQEPTVKIDP